MLRYNKDMEEERFNYIVLDSSSGSSWNSTTRQTTFTIPQHYFSEYRHDDEVYIQLESCVFIGQIIGATPTSNTSTIFMSGPTVYNQQNTYTEQLLGIVPCQVILYNTNSFISPSNVNTNNMKLRVDRFHEISLAVNYESILIDIDALLSPFRFILKVSYKKKN